MTQSIRLLFAAVLFLGVQACGDDGGTTDTGPAGDSSAGDSSAGDTGGADTGGGDAATDGGGGDATTDGGGGDATTDGGGDAATDGGGGDASARGCVDGPACPRDQMCCSGVPYPPQGVCMEMCTMRSDRHAKQDLEPVDGDAILERLSSIPITEWSYRDEAGAVRHVGPMAQDFRASFGLGSDDRTIHPVDAAGVTMAALQALTHRVEDLERENAALRAHTTQLEQRLSAER